MKKLVKIIVSAYREGRKYRVTQQQHLEWR